MKKLFTRSALALCGLFVSASAALATEPPELDVTGAMSGMVDKVTTAGNAALPVVVAIVGIFIVYRIIKRA
jgi:hypothetical protein